MTQHEASRTLVKSPPELWAECSDATSLARHLRDSFGEIRITRLEPETAVAWEGERASGTVRLEPAGWGTKVFLTATAVAREGEVPVAAPVAEPPAEVALETRAEVAIETPAEVATETRAEAATETPTTSTPIPRRRRFARLMAYFRRSELAGLPPEPPLPPPPEPPLEPPREPPPNPPLESPPDPDAHEPPPAPEVQPEEDDRAVQAPDGALQALAAALDSLGQAHHRPFSRG